VGYNSVAENGFIFIRLAVIASETREMSRNFEENLTLHLTAVQGHPKSSILVSMESSYVTSY